MNEIKLYSSFKCASDYLSKVVFIFTHSHISAFNSFLIICAIKLFFANSNQRHHCQPTKFFSTIDQIGQVLF